MPLPNHMLHSTLSQPVTNARASGEWVQEEGAVVAPPWTFHCAAVAHPAQATTTPARISGMSERRHCSIGPSASRLPRMTGACAAFTAHQLATRRLTPASQVDHGGRARQPVSCAPERLRARTRDTLPPPPPGTPTSPRSPTGSCRPSWWACRRVPTALATAWGTPMRPSSCPPCAATASRSRCGGRHAIQHGWEGGGGEGGWLSCASSPLRSLTAPPSSWTSR
jgi:hypothetical protein